MRRTMRLYLKRAVQCVCLVVLVQIGVYFWRVAEPKKISPYIVKHKYLEPVVKKEGTCTFQNCPSVKEDAINVHLIPHSHIDVGWVKSVEQYYVGQAVPNVWATGCVRCTLNATITELLKDPSRRFIFMEMKYLSRYWSEIDEIQRSVIRQLIKERRFELVNGGWVMSDAAVTMYNDLINQHTLGFDFIRDTFGTCAQTRTAWHVDQFGHSREHASILAQMGYDSLFIGRIDSDDLEKRKKSQSLEFVWKTSPQNLKERTALFTHVTYDGYYAPKSFNFEDRGFPLSDPQQAERFAADFLNVLKERSSAFKSRHLLVTMGCDFGYKDAVSWFQNMDVLIKKVHNMQDTSKSPRYNLFYSTPSCYTYHVNKDQKEFDTKSDDFHPYGFEGGYYWTGYFSTRGGIKMHTKKAGQILQSCKQLAIFAGLDKSFYKVNKLRDAMAVMQHHDAITGTQRFAVMEDYNRILSEAIEECQAVMSNANQEVWNMADGSVDELLSVNSIFCHDLNISSCRISEESKEFIVSVYSPLSWTTSVEVRFPILLSTLTVTDSEGKQLPTQVLPISEHIMKIPERQTTPDMEAVFQTRLPPMSLTSFTVKFEKELLKPSFSQTQEPNIVMENEHLSLTFDVNSGKLISIYNKDIHVMDKISQELGYYEAVRDGARGSGAYLFVPKPSGFKPIATDDKIYIQWIKGDVVQEVHQRFSSWATQVVRLYKGAKYAEFQWVVGPLDDSFGREVVSRFTSTLNSGNTFYTDSNGREVMTRTSVRKSVGENTTTIKDFVAGNYYPVTSRIFIQDKMRGIQLTIMPDRAQGGSSLASGSIELMVHRRLLIDDNLGVGEPVMDNGKDRQGIIYTGKHYLCLDSIENSVLLTKHLAQQIHMAPVMMFTPLKGDYASKKAPQQHVFLSAQLPDNVHILTLDKISAGSKNFFLLRLEHVFENSEHLVLSSVAEVSLKNLFKPFEVVSAEETTLGGNFRPHSVSRMVWDTSDSESFQPSIASPDYQENMEPPFTIKLRPMEIRTFRVQVV